MHVRVRTYVRAYSCMHACTRETGASVKTRQQTKTEKKSFVRLEFEDNLKMSIGEEGKKTYALREIGLFCYLSLRFVFFICRQLECLDSKEAFSSCFGMYVCTL